MASPDVVIVTFAEDDFAVKRVESALLRRGASCLRLDTDSFPSELRLSARIGPDQTRERFAASAGQPDFDASAVRSVLVRKVVQPELDPELDPAFHEACLRESYTAVIGWLAGLDQARWVNDIDAAMRAENKLRQLRVARAVGLFIPDTLVTNDGEEASRFVDEHQGQVVSKLLSSASMRMDGSGMRVFTHRVTPEELEHLESLQLCPVVFQEEVRKGVDIRAIVIGDDIHAGAIDPSHLRADVVDWRHPDGDELRWERCELPSEVSSALRRLLGELDLSYGAVDLVRTPEGQHQFLEINPGGEWGMLENELDLPVSESIADTLLK